MAFVLDCSVTMAWVFPDEANASTDALRESLLKGSAVVPVLWPMEVGNVLLVATRRGRLTEDDWPRIRDDLMALPIDVDTESCDRVLDTVLPRWAAALAKGTTPQESLGALDYLGSLLHDD